MTTTLSEGPIILVGYEYRLQFETDAPLFPAGCALAAQLRSTVASENTLASLSTSDGTLIRHDDHTLELVVSPEITSSLAIGSVVIDVVRTDIDPDRHLGFLIEIPVQQPVTRGL